MKVMQSKNTPKAEKNWRKFKNILAESLLHMRAETINDKHFAKKVGVALFNVLLIHVAFTGKIFSGINFLAIMLSSEFIHKMRTKDGKELQFWQKILMLVLAVGITSLLCGWFDYYLGDALVQSFRNWMGWK